MALQEIVKPLEIQRKKSRGAAFPLGTLTSSWHGAVRLGIAIGIAYFLAAQLGLALRSQVGMAVFWPAAGIATGALIALGPAARLPVAAAVAAASIASSFLIGRNTWLAVIFVVLNAGEVLLTAWLVVRQFGGVFKLEDVPHVLGFLVASAIAAAIGAAGAAIAVSFADTTVSPLQVWRIWFSAGLLGTVTVAPLLIGLGEALREVPRRREFVEGTIVLVTLAALSTFLISLPQGPWATALPVAFVFPLLLWIVVRCRPVFAAAAMFVVTLVIICSTTFNYGHFGDASTPQADRILAAQTLVLAGALLVLVIAALFSERRRSEAALKHSKERLQLALEGAELGAFSADLATGRLEFDARGAQIHGHDTSTITIKESRRFVHPDDRIRIDAALAEAKRSGGRWNAEYRVLPPPDHPHAGETRWIAVESSIVRDRRGTPAGLLGVTRDITERKRAEQSLADLNVQRALAARVGLVGTYAYDTDYNMDVAKTQISPGFAAIYGFPKGTTEIRRNAWRARVHPEDAERLQALLDQVFHRRRRRYKVDYRIVRAGEVRWIESRSFISYNNDGRPQRVIGVNIDITERKRAEERQRFLVSELNHRVKNVLATIKAIITQTQEASRSHKDFVIGLNRRIDSLDRTHELLSKSNWRGASLSEILRREFAPYAAANAEAGGPSVTLRAEATQAVAMVLHELTTNSAKYGAFSNRTGRVSVQWRWSQSGSHDRLVIEWLETGGPPVQAPSQSGYGTGIIRELIPFELGGKVELLFAFEGIRCRLEIPADWISSGGGVG
jgi:PAS domain S-box-containing protein